MTHHAVLDARDARNGALRNADMAEVALQLGFFDMRLVLIRNRLHGFGANSEEMSNRLAKRLVSGREDLI